MLFQVDILSSSLLSLVALLLYFVLRRYKMREQIFPSVSLKGKVAVITGANSGIGFETARNFAALGATVVFACRSRVLTENAIAELKMKTGNENLIFIQLDLCSLDSIRNFVSQFRSLGLRCHLLVNNAGVFYLHRSLTGKVSLETVDGFQEIFMSNYLGHFLLTGLMLDLFDPRSSRIVNLCSSLHRLSDLDFADIQGRDCPLIISYGRSKLATLYFTYELQRRLLARGSHITCNAVHPGIIATGIVRELGPFINKIFHFFFINMLGLDARRGAIGPTLVSISPEWEGLGGLYFSGLKPCRSKESSYDEKAAKKLWDISERLVNWQYDKVDDQKTISANGKDNA